MLVGLKSPWQYLRELSFFIADIVTNTEIFLPQMLMSVLMGHCTCVLNIVLTLWAAITVTATWGMSYNLMGLTVLVRLQY